jgi:hypothetical protein
MKSFALLVFGVVFAGGFGIVCVIWGIVTLLRGEYLIAVGKWHVAAGQLSGGAPRVVTAFNHARTASANGQITQAHSNASPLPWTFEAKSTVSFRPIAIA